MTDQAASLEHETARTAVLSAIAARPYFSTLRLADELRIDPGTARAIVDELDGAGWIRRDDTLAWTLTDDGEAELDAAGQRPSAIRVVRDSLQRFVPGTRAGGPARARRRTSTRR